MAEGSVPQTHLGSRPMDALPLVPPGIGFLLNWDRNDTRGLGSAVAPHSVQIPWAAAWLFVAARGLANAWVSGDRHPFCLLGSQSEPLRDVRGDGGLGSGGVGICLTGRPNKICRRHGRLLNFSPSRSLISYTNCGFFEPGSCFYLIFP